MGREEHEKCRMMSEAKNEPIVVTVMDEYEGDALSEEQIPQALEYLSIHVSLRDRKQITGILCSKQPDLLTQAVQEGVAAYDPVIRALHNAVDLSGTIGDLQLFIDDLLKFAPSSKATTPPSVDDMARLLRKHQHAAHKFLHQVCKNGPELSKWYAEYAKNAAAKFRVDENKENHNTGGAGILTSGLDSAVSSLSDKQRAEVITECDAHYEYLRRFTASATPSMKVKKSEASKPSTREGTPQQDTRAPVKFLARWQEYINQTSISPATLEEPIRYGGDADVVAAGRGATKIARVEAAKNEVKETAPNCAKTIEYLAGKFREMLRDSGRAAS